MGLCRGTLVYECFFMHELTCLHLSVSDHGKKTLLTLSVVMAADSLSDTG